SLVVGLFLVEPCPAFRDERSRMYRPRLGRRYAGGFQGRRAVDVALHADDSAVSQIDEDGEIGLDAYAARLASHGLVLEDQHAVAGIDQSLDLDVVLLPGLLVRLVVLPDLVDAAPDAALLDAADRRVQFDVRIDESIHSVPVRAYPALGESPHDLDVLLR